MSIRRVLYRLRKHPSLPAIPVATDLATAIAALNAIRQWIIQFTNPGTNTGLGTGQGNSPQPNPGTIINIGGAATGNFAEVTSKRTTTTTRIYDTNDPTNQTYVDMQQITGLVFANKAGQVINWSRS